jgi:hypothetical protein
MTISRPLGTDPVSTTQRRQQLVDAPADAPADAAADVQAPPPAPNAPAVDNTQALKDAAGLDFGDLPWTPPPPPPPDVKPYDVLSASYKQGVFGYQNPLYEVTAVDPDQVKHVIQDLLTTGEAHLDASMQGKDPETQKPVTLTSADLKLSPQQLAAIRNSGKDVATQGSMAFTQAWNAFAAANYVDGVPKAYGVHLDGGPIKLDDPVNMKEIHQFRDQDTCEAAAIQHQLARNNPQEYNRVMTDLLTQGYAAVPGYPNGVISLDPANKAWINNAANGLNDAEKKNAAFQAAMTSYLNNQAQAGGNNQYSSTWASYSLASGTTTLTTANYQDTYDEYGNSMGTQQTDTSDVVVTGGPVRQAQDLIKSQGGVYFSLPQTDQALQGEFLRTASEIKATDNDDVRSADQAKLDTWDHGAKREQALQDALDAAQAGGQEGVWVCVRTDGNGPPDPAAGYVANGDGQALLQQYSAKTGAPPPQDPNAKYHWTQLTGIKDGTATLEDANGDEVAIAVPDLVAAMAKSDDISAGTGGGSATVVGGTRTRG